MYSLDLEVNVFHNIALHVLETDPKDLVVEEALPILYHSSNAEHLVDLYWLFSLLLCIHVITVRFTLVLVTLVDL